MSSESVKKSKYKLAVGLSYENESEDAPSLAVKGSNLIADEVVRIARRYGIPVIEKPEEARAFAQLETGENIPPELYEAAALILREIEG